MKRPVTDRPDQLSILIDDSILDLAVDGTELVVQHLLGVLDDAANAVLHVLNGRTSLVTALGDDLSVVGRATAVPGKELNFDQH